MLVSKTKQKLREGKPVFGIGVHTNDPFITEIIGNAGFDYILIDGQHGPLEPNMLYDMVHGFGRTESDVIVRVTANEPWMIGQALDMGADGIIMDVHPVPEQAAIDPLQALSYPTFDNLMTELKAIGKAVGRPV